MIRSFKVLIFSLFALSFDAIAQHECGSGKSVVFELPFRGEVLYSPSGDRLPREFVSTDARLSICEENKNREFIDEISSFINQGVSENRKEFEIISVAESYEFGRVFYIGDEVFAFLMLSMGKGAVIPYPVRLVKSETKLELSGFPSNRNLETTLKYVLTFNKNSGGVVDKQSIRLSESETNPVLLHADILFPKDEHLIFEKVLTINELIEKGEYSSYLSLLDARSKEKSKKFLDGLAADQLQSSAEQAFSIPLIAYVIDANPVYFIAYDLAENRVTSDSQFQAESGLRFQTFFGENGDAVPWNLYFQNALTDLLTSNGVLKQIESLKKNP